MNNGTVIIKLHFVLDCYKFSVVAFNMAKIIQLILLVTVRNKKLNYKKKHNRYGMQNFGDKII